MSDHALQSARHGFPYALRRVIAMGTNTTQEQAQLALRIRERVRLYEQYGGHGAEADAWQAIHAWERATGRTWTGETPGTTGPEEAA